MGYNQVRQGDVLLVRRKRPVKLKGEKIAPENDGSIVLAHGEVTGHRHRYTKGSDVELFGGKDAPGTSRILVLRDKLNVLLHEEHAKIELALAENEAEIQYDLPQQMSETRKAPAVIVAD